MEFDIYNVAGGKKMIEGESIEIGDKSIVIRDKEGDVIWWINPNAVAFINYKKDDRPKIELVKP